MMWYLIKQTDSIATPSLAIYLDRVRRNISHMIAVAKGPDRLCPHVKTHKMAAVSQLYMQQGVRQFKCATIAEAEMLAQCGVGLVLLAYQPVGPQAGRLARLAQSFPKVEFAAVVDHLAIAQQLSTVAADAQIQLGVLLDIDVGMGRTGIPVGPGAETLYRRVDELPGLRCGGLHVYDGHIRDRDLSVRTQRVEEAFAPGDRLSRAFELTRAGGTSDDCWRLRRRFLSMPLTTTVFAVPAPAYSGTQDTTNSFQTWTLFRPLCCLRA